ncbi:MAG: cold shock domain-containing protein [Paludibacter sp.]
MPGLKKIINFEGERKIYRSSEVRYSLCGYRADMCVDGDIWVLGHILKKISKITYMSIRLSKVCKDLNIRMKEAIEFLHSKGFEIRFDPNYKLQEDLVNLLQNEYHKKKFKTDITTINLTLSDSKTKDSKEDKTIDFKSLKKQQLNFEQQNKKRETGIVSRTHDLYGFINYKKEEIFFHQSSVKNKILLEVGDIVSFKINPSTKKAGKFVAEEIEIIKKKSPDSNQKYPTKHVKHNNKIFNIPNTLYDNAKLINGISNFNIDELLNTIEQIIKKNNDLIEAILLIEILKLENSKNYSTRKLNSNINFWLLWFSDLESTKFIKNLIEFSDEEIITKFMIAQRKEWKFYLQNQKTIYKLTPINYSQIMVKRYTW